MAKGTFARVLVVGGMVAALACSRNTQDETTGAAPRDTVRSNGTVNAQERDTMKNPTGMNRDTSSSASPSSTAAPSGQVNRDTLGYSGIERDTTGQGKMKRDSTSSGAAGASSTTGTSTSTSTGASTSDSIKTPTGDTTGYGGSKKKQPPQH
jgi:hypothetical protein